MPTWHSTTWIDQRIWCTKNLSFSLWYIFFEFSMNTFLVGKNSWGNPENADSRLAILRHHTNIWLRVFCLFVCLYFCFSLKVTLIKLTKTFLCAIYYWIIGWPIMQLVINFTLKSKPYGILSIYWTKLSPWCSYCRLICDLA